MKRFLFLLIAVLLSVPVFAQNNVGEKKTASKALEFISRGSSFIKKEYYDLGNVKGVKCQVMIITDLSNNEKMGCLRLEKKYTGYSTSDTYVGTLDYDEMEDCIKSVNYIRDNMLPSTPNIYTEVKFISRDNIEIGAFYSEEKQSWVEYIYTQGYAEQSVEYFDSWSFYTLVSKMTKAKDMIAEKLRQ